MSTRDAILCPSCGGEDHRVIDSRASLKGIRRRRACACGYRFSTLETINTKPDKPNTVRDEVLSTLAVLDKLTGVKKKSRRTPALPGWVPKELHALYRDVACIDEALAAKHVRSVKKLLSDAPQRKMDLLRDALEDLLHDHEERITKDNLSRRRARAALAETEKTNCD